jgi:CBS domain-containing protein
MQCKDVMKAPVITCREHDTVAKCARLMAENGIGFLPVLDGDHELLGVVTDRDLATRVLGGQKPPSASVGEVMTHNVVHCSTTDSLAIAERLLADSRKARLVLLDPSGKVAGVLSLADIGQVEDAERAGRLFKRVTRREATGIVSEE